MPLPRIRLATDNPNKPDYWLHDARAGEDLAAMGDCLSDDARVLLVRPGVFELEAVLRFQHEVNVWVAYPVRGEPR